MAEINAPNLIVVSLFSTVSLAYLTFHIYKFDKFRCLVPRRKDWFRCLLIYMLVLSNICLCVWAFGWAYVKTQLGWVRLGPTGARPWPSVLFPDHLRAFNTPLIIVLGFSYGLQACLTVEEALYWGHLMRAVQRPQAAVPFLSSHFFHGWLFLCVIITTISQGGPWVSFHGDLSLQLARELLVGGILEMIVLIPSTILVARFPQLLRDVAVSGAGPDVRARLFYFHQLNKSRTLFRYTFSIPLVILGIDGLTEAKIIALNPLASDCLTTLIGGSLAAVTMISIVLYLPRSAPSAIQQRVMVGQPGHGTSAFALVTLLREGGQLDAVGDGVTGSERERTESDAPFARARSRDSGWDLGAEEDWQRQKSAREPAPRLLVDSFISPIAVSDSAQPQRPVQIHMRVEQEIRHD